MTDNKNTPRQIDVRLSDIEPLSPTLKRLTFVPIGTAAFPVIPTGSHVIVSIPGSRRTHKNAYSLIGPADKTDAYQIVVRKVDKSRGGSSWIHEQAKVGDRLQISWPSSLFPLSNIACHHLLISGGIGITPILSHLHALTARGASFSLHHACKAEDRDAFLTLLAPFHGHDITLYVADDPSSSRLDLQAVMGRQLLGTVLYTCGPQKLTNAIMETGRALGWPASSLQTESFGGARAGTAFTLHALRSDKIILVDEESSILEALEGAGIEPTYLCRGGACGQCLTSVIDGIPEHRDDFLDEQERATNKKIMICVSRACSPSLTLDI
ncbi:Flavodoxin reductase family [Granulibacter bethesdensis]|uniref:Flavodoxin reductase family n=1 Tax=Granulibacter bethesdensis TaxID=364410 RepID=A0AAC9KF93_9PROT|nr:PDR/VanB family oxidoreductase [Granulibacter bethesdensis]APH55140.1 Flavodoxin reductase family [Granulibacter bethesdensis]APH62725.1 Flavodoxin reductase family [Granulibacter bethesdensis]